jgi:hypothetical protein
MLHPTQESPVDFRTKFLVPTFVMSSPLPVELTVSEPVRTVPPDPVRQVAGTVVAAAKALLAITAPRARTTNIVNPSFFSFMFRFPF